MSCHFSMAPTEPSSCWLKTRIVFAVIGLLLGITIFFCFGFAYANWDTAAFGLLSGLFAALTLWVHLTYKKDQWQRSSYRLRYLMLFGCIGQLAGLCGMVTYISLAIIEKLPLTPYGPKGYYLTAIWSFMAWKWGFLLFLYGKEYRTLFEVTFHRSPDVKYEQL